MCKVCLRRGLNCDYSLRLKWVDNDEVGSGVSEQGYRAPRLKRTKRKTLGTSSTPSSTTSEIPSNVGSSSSDFNNSASSSATVPPQFNKTFAQPGFQRPHSFSSVEPPPMTTQFFGQSTPGQIGTSSDYFGTHFDAGLPQFDFQLGSSTGLASPLAYSTPNSNFNTNLYPPTSEYPFSPSAPNYAHTPHIINSPLQNSQQQHQYATQQNFIPQELQQQQNQDPIIQALYASLPDASLEPLLTYYLRATCICLDPLHDGRNQVSYFLPFAIRSQSAISSILATAALHLHEAASIMGVTAAANTYTQRYSELAIKYKAKSFQYLTKEIQHHLNPSTSTDLPILAAILAQLELNIFEVRSNEYAMHLNAWRETVKGILVPRVGDRNSTSGTSDGNGSNSGGDYSRWFLAARIAKYDTFAVMVNNLKPILSITVAQNANMLIRLDSAWSLPSKWVILCATISYWSCRSPDSQTAYLRSSELTYIEEQLSMPISTPLNTRQQHSRQIEDTLIMIWQITTSIHYHRLIIYPGLRADLNPALTSAFNTAIFTIQQYLQDHGTDFRMIALAWPLFVLVYTAFKPQDKAVVQDIVVRIWRFLRIPTFSRIMQIAQVMWAIDVNMGVREYNMVIQSQSTNLFA